MSQLQHIDEMWHPLALPAGLSSTQLVSRLVELPDLAQRVGVLSPQNLLLLMQEIGLEDAMFLFEAATAEQIQGILDLTIWPGTSPDYDRVVAWLDYAASTSDEALLRTLRGTDPEILMSLILERATLFHRPDSEEDIEFEGELHYTPDRLFAFGFATTEDGETNDAAVTIRKAIQVLYRDDVDFVRRLLFTLLPEAQSNLEETLYQFRLGRLEDLGFLPFDEASTLYHVESLPRLRLTLEEEIREMRPSAAPPGDALPEALVPLEPESLLARVLATLHHDERQQFFIHLTYLVNRSLVAREIPLDDMDLARREIRWVASHLNLGLESLAAGDFDTARAMVTRTSLLNVFRGSNAVLHPVRRRAQGLLRRFGIPRGYRLLSDAETHFIEALASRFPVRHAEPESSPFVTLAEVERATQHVARFEAIADWLERRLGFTPAVLDAMVPEHGDRVVHLSLPLLLATLVVHRVTSGEFRIDSITEEQCQQVIRLWFGAGPKLSAATREQVIGDTFAKLVDSHAELEEPSMRYLINATFEFLESELGTLDASAALDPRGLPIGFLRVSH
ncbi:MAG: hypothetical protein KC609_14350 [Myxococcales bacterium]|nr:hypothetical protein [Myxococcales bacterium]